MGGLIVVGVVVGGGSLWMGGLIVVGVVGGGGGS